MRYMAKLNFNSPLHSGQREKDYNFTDIIIHSDTLFSGIINCYSFLYGKRKTDDLVARFINGEVPFRVSSCFPYYKDELYVPKPINMGLSKAIDDEKEAKKIRFIPLEVLTRGVLNNKVNILPNGFISLKYINPFIKVVDEIPRVALDSITNASMIYYVSNTLFDKDAGLWFAVDFFDDEIKKEFTAALRLLGDEGIGGERTYGSGLFELEGGDLLPLDIKNDNQGKHVLLSMYFPQTDEIEKITGPYEIVEREGYAYNLFGIAHQRRKRRINMFLEGSVFDFRPKGRVVDVTPRGCTEMTLVKNGLAFTLKVGYDQYRG